jgi:hypothetical protein
VTRILVVKRPYLFMIEGADVAVPLTSVEAQRLIDAHTPLDSYQVDDQCLRIHDPQGYWVVIQPATRGGGPAFVKG